MKLAEHTAQREKTIESKTGFAVSLLNYLPTSLRQGLKGIYRRRGEPCMALLETLQLGGKRQLMLVVCDGHRYLVGAGAESVSSIAEISPMPAPAPPPKVADDGLPEFEPQEAPQRSQGEGRCN